MDPESYEDDNILEDDDEEEDFNDEMEGEPEIFLPGVHELQEGEVLEFDKSAYHVMEPMTVEWPCLSFDIISDNLGQYRTKFPQTVYMTAGTQAFDNNENRLMIFKISNIHKLQQEDDSSEDSDVDENENQPQIQMQYIKHDGAINRVRKMPQKQNIIGTWSDTGAVNIFDASNHISKLDNDKQKFNLNVGPIQSFKGHNTEGYSIDWNPLSTGRLVTGDCNNKIFLWEFNESKWVVDNNPFAEHTGSVEDLQWSPTEVNGFASCSVDKTLKVWDCRSKGKSLATIQAHNSDVNVISWHKTIPYLILSGCDDGEFKVWDMRKWKNEGAYATFNFHKQAITSVEWSTFDENLFAVSSADNSVTLWDMSLYEDEEDKLQNNSEKQNIPQQLMFLHMGQQDIKEVHFHPQVPGLVVSTAVDGFNFWRPMNIEVEKDDN